MNLVAVFALTFLTISQVGATCTGRASIRYHFFAQPEVEERTIEVSFSPGFNLCQQLFTQRNFEAMVTIDSGGGALQYIGPLDLRGHTPHIISSGSDQRFEFFLELLAENKLRFHMRSRSPSEDQHQVTMLQVEPVELDCQ